MNGAAQTLVSQAYGAENLRMCGVYLNRARLINTAAFIPLIVLVVFCKQILAKLGQDAKVIEFAFEYVIICLPGVYCQVMFDLKKRFLNCMNISWVPMLA